MQQEAWQSLTSVKKKLNANLSQTVHLIQTGLNIARFTELTEFNLFTVLFLNAL